MSDIPIITYNNLLRGSGYTMLVGTDTPAAPLSDAWTWDMSRPALPQADASGILSFSVNTPAGVGFGIDAAGNSAAFGQILPFGGKETADIMILGAARNNASGVRFSGGYLQVLADGVEVFGQTIYEPKNTSVLYNLLPHAAPLVYTITITGLAASATVRLPELFIGPALRMPHLNLGHDWDPETIESTSFKAATGRTIRSRRYVRIEQQLRWSYLDAEMINEIKRFTEEALEMLQPFWFIAFPNSSPTGCYMGIHTGNKTSMPLGAGMIVNSFHLKFEEKL